MLTKKREKQNLITKISWFFFATNLTTKEEEEEEEEEEENVEIFKEKKNKKKIKSRATHNHKPIKFHENKNKKT